MRMPPKLKPLAALLLMCPLAACSTAIGGTDSSCKSFRPLSWSKKDTHQTQREVVGHNKAWDAICK